MKKRLFSLLLAVAMVVGILPTVAFAANEITVTVNISHSGEFVVGKDNTTIVGTQVTLTGKDSYTIDDALRATHEAYYDGENGYETTVTGYGNSIVTLWGDRSGNFGYWANGVSAWSPDDLITNGSIVEAFVTESKYPNNEPYTKLEVMSDLYSNVPVKVKLTQAGYDASYNMVFAPCEGATIWLDGIQTPAVTNVDGIAFVDVSEGSHWLTAKKQNGGITSIVAPYVTATISEELSQTDIDNVLIADANTLVFDKIKAENAETNAIIEDLTLPTIGDSGKTAITWTSVNSAIATDGTVTRPSNANGDATGKLTATISYGETTRTVEFDLTVTALPSNEVVLASAIEKVESTMEVIEFSGDAYADTNIITMIGDLIDNDVIDTSITANNNNVAISSDGAITYGAEDATAELTITLTLEADTTTKDIVVNVPAHTFSKEDALAGEWLTVEDYFEFADGDTIDRVIQNFSLEEDGEGYTEITWESSNEDVLKLGEYSADVTVSRPIVGEENATVVLTATIEGGLYWDYSMGPVGPMPSNTTTTKTFTVTVPALTQDEVDAAQTLLNTALDLFTLDNVTKRDGGEAADLMALTYHVNGFPFNWNYVDGESDEQKNIAITWNTTNPGFKDSQISTGAEVIRTDANQTGDIVLTLYYNGATSTKTWPTKILAWNDEEETAENVTLQTVADGIAYSVFHNPGDKDSSYNKDTNWISPQGSVVVDGVTTFYRMEQSHVEGAKIAWTSGNTAVIANPVYGYLAITPQEKPTNVTLTATLTSARFPEKVTPITQEIVVTIPGTAPSSYADDIASIVAVYNTESLPLAWENVALKNVPFTEETAKSAAQAAIDALTADPVNVSNAMKAVITLKALEYDPANITLADDTTINAYDVLNNNATASNMYLAPYVLLALGEEVTSEQKTAHIDYLCAEIVKDSNYNWGVDGVAFAIAALAPYYEQNNVKTAVDEALVKIESKVTDSNSEMNTNTNAMLILAYTMLGKDPTAVHYRDDTNIVADMLKATLENKTGFGWKDNTTLNLRATNQGLLALYALDAYETGHIVNPFDLSETAVNPLDEADLIDDSGSSDGDGSNPGSTPTPGDSEFDVTFSVMDDENRTWFTEIVTLEDGDTVKDAFDAAFAEHEDYSLDVDGGTYVKSITHPTFGKYGEFTNGNNSGWKYKVNGTAPGVGFHTYEVGEDDEVVFYFVVDYTVDTTPSVGGGITAPEEEIPEEETTASVENFTDVKADDWFYDATAYVVEKGLFNGTSTTNFAPNDNMTRGMIMTVLHRYSGDETVAQTGNWQEAGMTWSKENGISDGTKPNENVTREQLVTMLYRYTMAEKTEADMSVFTDADQVSSWAVDAMSWAIANGMIQGTSTTTLDPTGNATRAQVAAMMMRFASLMEQ